MPISEASFDNEFRIVRGTHKTLKLYVRKQDGAPYDLTGATILLSVKRLPTDTAVLVSKTAITTPTVKVATAVAINAPGSGYAVGNILTIVGGTGLATTLLVEAILLGGAITSVSIVEPGGYTVEPVNPVSVTGGAGTLAKFDLTLVDGPLNHSGSIIEPKAGYAEVYFFPADTSGLAVGEYVYDVQVITSVPRTFSVLKATLFKIEQDIG